MKSQLTIFHLLFSLVLTTQILLGEQSPAPQPTPANADLKLPMTGDTPDQQLFFCTTRIEAATGDGKRQSIGTGFIINEKIDEKRQFLFIVTCRHVVDGFDAAKVSFVAAKGAKPDLGQRCG